MRVERREGDGVSLTEALNSADLGCSSEYSMGNVEARSAEGFLVNSSWKRVRPSEGKV